MLVMHGHLAIYIGEIASSTTPTSENQRISPNSKAKAPSPPHSCALERWWDKVVGNSGDAKSMAKSRMHKARNVGRRGSLARMVG